MHEGLIYTHIALLVKSYIKEVVIIKKTILFAPETFNLAETTRSIEVAKKCSEHFTCLFMGYSEKYVYLIEEANFQFIYLKPHLNEADIEQIMKVDQGKGIKHPFTYKMLKSRVENEKEVIEKYRPAAVVIGTTLSMFISSRACHTPLIYIKPFAYTRTYFLKGHLELPSILRKSFIPKEITKSILSKAALHITYKPRAFARIAKEEKVSLPKYTIDALDADYNLITTIPEISGVQDIPNNYRYIGPVYAKLEKQIPSFLLTLPRDKPTIYFAMGSSGSKEIILKVLRMLEHLPINVICPMRDKLGNQEFNSNIYICDLLPAHKLADIFDLSIIHGGEGTVQTACITGKPFIGIGLQQEQVSNIRDCVLFGNALMLDKNNISVEELFRLIDEAKASKKMQERAKAMQELLKDVDGPANAAEYLIGNFSS
jgi:UDP:flavonoid glycosyltransferase YjiC (YdhE family)